MINPAITLRVIKRSRALRPFKARLDQFIAQRWLTLQKLLAVKRVSSTLQQSKQLFNALHKSLLGFLSHHNSIFPMTLKSVFSSESNKSKAYAQSVDPKELNVLRNKMVKFATMQLGDKDQAEDAVQEALLAALKNSAAYEGRASLKTWVFAILKNKITDMVRKRYRERLVSTQLGDTELDEQADMTDLFNSAGMWGPDERPASWGNPIQSLDDKQFWQIFELCLDGLPSQQAKAFMMREYIGLETIEICQEMTINSNNLHVLLHRSRLRLRECLENRWFRKEASTC